ncbi:MAG: hypothetical protein F6J93_29905 [Oscillatoria sp. SIO1A7]|nr:hypothetical protein [Oscillatoria sp. SIO1A7]
MKSEKGVGCEVRGSNRQIFCLSLHPTPYRHAPVIAQCPMPNAQCPIPNYLLYLINVSIIDRHLTDEHFSTR